MTALSDARTRVPCEATLWFGDIKAEATSGLRASPITRSIINNERSADILKPVLILPVRLIHWEKSFKRKAYWSFY